MIIENKNWNKQFIYFEILIPFTIEMAKLS